LKKSLEKDEQFTVFYEIRVDDKWEPGSIFLIFLIYCIWLR
jgi:hypothetical protein